VTVPNDFSELQEKLLEEQEITDRFWIALPDHLSYFTSKSLAATAEATGWCCQSVQGDFPIDLYLAHPGSNYISNRSSLGLVLLAGTRTATPNFIFDGVNHQTKYEYGLGYNYLWYFDNTGTSQRSGGFGIHLQEFSIMVENDLFAGSGRDRFRTSYFGVHYHTDILNLSLNTQLWTGETWGTKLRNTSDSIYQVGYKDLRKTLYGRKSHGILSVGVDYLMGYGNRIHTLIGIDHELIRHGLQYRFMHNKPFVPKKWRTPNVNYPMLNEEGIPVHQTGKERSGLFYYQFGLNRGLTY
jgi:hypothetical protein